MNNKALKIFLLFFILLKGPDSFASHIFGGELLYTHIGGTTYKLTLTLYGDCGADPGIFDSLYHARPDILIYDGNVQGAQINLDVEEAGTEVSPVCAAELHNTKCNGGTQPGVKRFKYSKTITLPHRSKNWVFVFPGGLGSVNSGAGRSRNITNIIQPINNSSIMELKARLDNTLAEDNSSPAYSTIPTPYYCINLQGEYSQGAIDPDGDSLAFALVPGRDGNLETDVFYTSPYTATEPLSTSGKFIFSPLNGQISFTPDAIQYALVVCQVSEYRKGVLVGTSEREMTFIVIDGCKGVPPTARLNNVSGGTVTGNNVINICAGTPHLTFNINIDNPDNDNTALVTNNTPSGATLNIINNNSTSPSVTFDWATGNIPSGIYTFYLNINNDHCPLANRSTVAYTINVAPPPVLSYTLLSSTQCLHKALLQYNLNYGYAPRTVTISQGADVYKTYIDSTGTIVDSLPLGFYSVVTSSNEFCKSTSTIGITDSGDLPLLPLVKNYCINGPTAAIIIEPIGAEAIITWYYSNGDLLFYPPIPDTKTVGTQHFSYTEQYRQCIKTNVPVSAVVHPLPLPELLAASKPETICIGDTIALRATGGVTYTWTPADQVLFDTANMPYIRVTEPVLIQIKAIDSFGCADSATYRYKDIQYCCKFSYPNAFTPNNDGVNDGFRIISYGNLVEYKLAIYNRWGQEVFETADPRQYWDGTFNGIPCDMGNYYYFFKAKCLTGNKEESKGDVLLIR
ncbi:MAG: gliding motility-associated C-terminal protein [Flavipsychrobacter sp.]|nr:gliding motility-associated C-terminal protein [Flavipsychrobacter sp.]